MLLLLLFAMIFFLPLDYEGVPQEHYLCGIYSDKQGLVILYMYNLYIPVASMASCIRSRFAHAKPYAACHRRRWGTKDDAPEVEKGYGGNIILNVQLQCNAANSKMEFIIRFYAEPLFVFCFLCTTAQHHHTYYISSTHRPSPLLSPLVQVTSSSPFKQGNM